MTSASDYDDAGTILLVGEGGRMTTTLNAAQDSLPEGKDLKLVDGRQAIPVYRVVDSIELDEGRTAYKQKKAERNRRTSKTKVKTITMSAFIQNADMVRKLNDAKRHLDQGHKVTLAVQINPVRKRTGSAFADIFGTIAQNLPEGMRMTPPSKFPNNQRVLSATLEVI